MLTTSATLSGDTSPFTRIPVTFLRPDGSAAASNAYVGQLSWSGMTGAAAGLGVPAAFKSFCIDGLQSVSPGANTFGTEAPLVTSSLLGSARGELLFDFWRQYGPVDAAGFADKTDSAAFQLAVWEIINDGIRNGTKLTADLTTGRFVVNASIGSTPAMARAAQWLAGFDTTALTKSSVALYALENPTKQDQAVAVPIVDLDVDSDNDGTLMRSVLEEREEGEGVANGSTTPTKSGLIVPVGGSRARMIVEVPAGRTASLAIPQGAERVRVYAPNDPNPLAFPLSVSAPAGTGSATFTYWIEAVAPSAGMADIVFTLTTTGTGPVSSDTVRATAVAVDLDVDSNNDGTIDHDNGPKGTDDPIEEALPGRIIFVNSDDDDRNGKADVLDVGRVAGENDLGEVRLALTPSIGPGVGSIIVTYDETIVRLYTRPDRSGPIASGVAIATGGVFYAEGRIAGRSLVTVTWKVGALQGTDTVSLTVQAYPATIDVDIDSDNNNGFGQPARSEWEDILENHDYAIGKLIMLDNPQRAVTPIVLEIAAGLPVNSPVVGVRIDWDVTGPAGWVRLWNTGVADALRNPGSVHLGQGGNYIAPGFVCKLSDLNYNPRTGTIMIWAEGIRENEQLKTLAGVEAAPRVDERICGTLVVNGDDAASDEVKYIVANEDSFYYALHTRQEVRNALASRGVYKFDDMPKFSLQPKSPLDLHRLGVPDTANLLLGEGSGMAGFKAMVYQDYITGENQYVLAFGGTDGLGDPADWFNNIVQGSGLFGAPPQYAAAMLIGDALSRSNGILAGHVITTGHSLGGGLASAAAVVGGFRADTFNAAWLRREELLDTLAPDGRGGFLERYPGSLARFDGAAGTINAYYVDWDLLTFLQRRASNIMSIHPVGTLLERDGPHDTTPGEDLYLMVELHLMPSVLYGLLVTESGFGWITIDMLGYDAYFGN